MSGGKVYWWWPLAQVEIGPIWIATYRMDEYPLRYVSETKWMDFHIRKGCMSTFSHSWMTTSFGWKLRASFEWSLAKITKSMAPCRLTPVSTCQCPVNCPLIHDLWSLDWGPGSPRTEAHLPHIHTLLVRGRSLKVGYDKTMWQCVKVWMNFHIRKGWTSLSVTAGWLQASNEA